MKKHSYGGIYRITITISQIGGVFVLLFFTSFTVFSVAIGFLKISSNSESILDDPRITLLCFMTIFFIISFYIGSTLINQLPTIWVDEEGLIVSTFVFLRVRIPWSDILDIGTGTPPRGYLLVRARRITPFHRVYGWLYSHTFYPSFLIGKGINDRDNLIREIKQRIESSA